MVKYLFEGGEQDFWETATSAKSVGLFRVEPIADSEYDFIGTAVLIVRYAPATAEIIYWWEYYIEFG